MICCTFFFCSLYCGDAKSRYYIGQDFTNRSSIIVPGKAADMWTWRRLSIWLLCIVAFTHHQFSQAKSIPQTKLLYRLLVEYLEQRELDDCLGSCEEEKRKKEELKEAHKLLAEKQGQDPTADGFEEKLASSKIAKLEGDIRLTGPQVDALLNAIRQRNKRKMATFGGDFQKWKTFPIKYDFNGQHNKKQRGQIESAMHHWHAQTCIRFQRAGDNEVVQGTYIWFTAESGCSSYIGKTDQKKQRVDLAPNCDWGTAVHELGHVIGFWHEHQRSDRNNYVKILQENMMFTLEMLAQVSRKGFTQTMVPYDYGSIMHYSSHVHSKSGQTSIKPVDPLFLKTVGQRTGLSFADAKMANLEYCQGICRNKLYKKCQNNGYQDPNNCYGCKCPDGFSGTYCQSLQPAKGAVCGGTKHVSSWSTYINSPNYYNGHYKDRVECTWLFKAPRGHRVVLQFYGDFSIYCHKEGYNTVCYHWVEVRYQKDLTLTGPRFCCNTRPSVALRSEGQDMLVLLRANYTTSSRHKGFKAKVYAELTGGPPEPAPATTATALPPDGISPAPTPAPHNRCGSMDIAFVLDSSGSVEKAGWSDLLQFVIKLVSNLGMNNNQYGVISFGNKGTLNIKLSDFKSISAFASAVHKIPFKDQNTNTVDGLRVMNKKLYTSTNGGRAGATKLAILVTDGKATKEAKDLDEMARKSRETEGIILIGVGVGTGADIQELYRVTGYSNRVITVKNFSTLKKNGAVKQIGDKVKEFQQNCVDQTTRITSTVSTTTTKRPTTTTTRSTTRPTTTSPTTTTTRPTIATTRKTTTTTTKPTTTQKLVLTDSWWSFWSKCTVTCGGCGRQKRQRTCFYNGAHYKTCGEETRKCGTRPCGGGDRCMYHNGLSEYWRTCNVCCSNYIFEGNRCIAKR